MKHRRFILLAPRTLRILALLALMCFGSNAFAESKATGPAVESKKILLVIGDSLTEGLGVKKSEAYPALLELKIAKYLQEQKKNSSTKWQVLNAGQSGWTSASGLRQLKWQTKGKSKPHLLLLALGANDGLRGLSVADTKKNLAEVLSEAKNLGIPAILAGMLMPPNYGKSYTEDFRKMYLQLAKEFKVSLIPFLLEGVAGDKALNIEDGIHPNAKGHQRIADLVFPAVRSFL